MKFANMWGKNHILPYPPVKISTKKRQRSVMKQGLISVPGQRVLCSMAFSETGKKSWKLRFKKILILLNYTISKILEICDRISMIDSFLLVSYHPFYSCKKFINDCLQYCSFPDEIKLTLLSSLSDISIPNALIHHCRCDNFYAAQPCVPLDVVDVTSWFPSSVYSSFRSLPHYQLRWFFFWMLQTMSSKMHTTHSDLVSDLW